MLAVSAHSVGTGATLGVLVEEAGTAMSDRFARGGLTLSFPQRPSAGYILQEPLLPCRGRQEPGRTWTDIHATDQHPVRQNKKSMVYLGVTRGQGEVRTSGDSDARWGGQAARRPPYAWGERPMGRPGAKSGSPSGVSAPGPLAQLTGRAPGRVATCITGSVQDSGR